MAQNKYSNDVFFEPWVGQEYYSGIKVDANGNFEKGPHKEKGQEPEEGFYRVMILGLEHYCENREKCEKYNKLNNNPNEICHMHEPLENTEKEKKKKEILECAKISYCKGYTRHVIEDILLKQKDPKQGWESSSHKLFLQALSDNKDRELWNYLSFFNFIQHAMPKTSGNYPSDNDKKEGAIAFSEVVTKLEPDIIFVWGEKFELEKNLQGTDISINSMKNSDTWYDMPNICINKKVIFFTTLKWQNEKKESLLIFLPHPSKWKYTGFKTDEIKSFILCVFQNKTTFLQWDIKGTQMVAPKTYKSSKEGKLE